METETYQQINMVLHVAIIVLLLWVIFFRTEGLRTTGYVGAGVGNQVFTSGATMRRLAQKFSSANQGEYLTVHNIENPDAVINMKVVPTERFQVVAADLGGYVGTGVSNQVYASGPTMRRLAQVMTSANQGETVTIHNVENPEAPAIKVMAASI